MAQIAAIPLCDDTRWLDYLSHGALLHANAKVLAHNASASPFLRLAALSQHMALLQHDSSELMVDDSGTPWVMQSRYLAELDCWLTQIQAAMDENFSQLILANPRPMLVHDNFKPLFVNQAYAELFQLSSVSQLLQMDSIRPLIGEEHWPQAQRNYQQLMIHGHLLAEPVSNSWTCGGDQLRTRIQDFVIQWQGRKALCTVIHDVGNEHDKLEQFRHMAFTDPLTSIGNRRSFNEQGHTHLLACLNHDKLPILAIVDVDHFKRINDNYGHPLGDMVLQHIAKVLRDCVDEHGFAARIGGEEFALFAAMSNRADAMAWIKAVKQRVDQSPYLLDDGSGIDVRISIGLTQWQGGNDHLGDMYQRADGALYLAKRRGRDQIRLA
ncbi:GGDEF domain-containing protein [uncultured Ferrimonas sp.]|uniref:GGDEF domain-containing protein n=1 Tax=uncultured Ferrimonas sp. TaxID=432640 RepID=UPI00262C6553|nr:GGDEF domain-containing protein [uncultured Ferrimonas sp.]